jgi:hypothetical protein
MKTTVSTKGQLILPAELRKQDAIEAGQTFTVKRLREGQYEFTREECGNNVGLVDWLLSCPAKGFFVPLESESTDTL